MTANAAYLVSCFPADSLNALALNHGRARSQSPKCIGKASMHLPAEWPDEGQTKFLKSSRLKLLKSKTLIYSLSCFEARHLSGLDIRL
jgi:hypothetical protein